MAGRQCFGITTRLKVSAGILIACKDGGVVVDPFENAKGSALVTDVDDDLNAWLSRFDDLDSNSQRQSFFAKLEQITRTHRDNLDSDDHLRANADIFEFDHFCAEFARYYRPVAANEAGATALEFLSQGSELALLGLTAEVASCFMPVSGDEDAANGLVIDEVSPAACRYLVYHFHAALCIYRRLRQVECENQLLRAVIDSRTRAILVCDSNGVIVHHNSRAKELLIQHQYFKRQGNRLSLARIAEQRQLAAYLNEACEATEGCGFWGLRVGREPAYSVCLRPLAATGQQAALKRPLCLVIIMADDCGCAPAEVATLFDLSAKEIMVLNYMLKGLSLPDIAGELFITHNTVRSHVRSIFQKTHTRSQLALVSYVQQLAGSF